MFQISVFLNVARTRGEGEGAAVVFWGGRGGRVGNRDGRKGIYTESIISRHFHDGACVIRKLLAGHENQDFLYKRCVRMLVLVMACDITVLNQYNSSWYAVFCLLELAQGFKKKKKICPPQFHFLAGTYLCMLSDLEDTHVVCEGIAVCAIVTMPIKSVRVITT